MKSPEFVPASEEIREEEERINKGDLKSNKEGRPLKPFVPKEEIPNSDIDEEEKIADAIDTKKAEEINEKISKEEKLKQQIINDIKKNEKIGFLQNDIGVAHVGPEFNDANQSDKLITESMESKSDNHPYRKSWKESFSNLFKYGFEPRKGDRNTGMEKDNLKTMSDSEKERNSRKKIKEIIDNPENFSNN